MKINDKDVDIETLVTEDLHKNLHKLYKNDIYLNDNDIDVLKKYDFDVDKYSNVKSLILDIEEYLDENYDMEFDDLEQVADSLQEFNYYHNTDK